MRTFRTGLVLMVFLLMWTGSAFAGMAHHGKGNPFQMSGDHKQRPHCMLNNHHHEGPCPHMKQGMMDPRVPCVIASDCGGMPQGSLPQMSHSLSMPVESSASGVLHFGTSRSFSSSDGTVHFPGFIDHLDPPPRFL